MEEIKEDVDGIIQSIYVENFFCHKRLNMTLNPNVNFIVGRNGSGKSAILSALVVGLGARASTTNRGTNLSSLIRKDDKEENRTAVIKIKLKNSGPQAFKHEQYGDSITIVRKIKSAGSSSYEVQSASGTVISTKFEEVNAITVAHDIQVDNPISVLNQDDARSFHEADAKKKYALFRRATNLDLIESNYNSAKDLCKKAKKNLNKKIAASAELEKDYKKWKNIYTQYQSRDEIKAQKKLLQNEFLWSEIVELERYVNKLQEDYENEKTRVNELVEQLQAMERNFGNSEAIDALKGSLDAFNLQKTALEREIQDLEADLASKEQARRGAANNAHKYQEQLTREQRNVTTIEEEIQNAQSGSSAARQQKLQREHEQLQLEAAASQARRDKCAQEAEQARLHAARAAAAADDLRLAANNTRANCRKLQQQVRELESRGGDSLAVFGGNMAELCQRLRASERLFSQPPKGPVGAYIKVKDKKWAGVLERIMGGALQSFCVNTPEDSRKLFEIMNQVYGRARKPAVTCSEFLARQHDVRRSSVRVRGLTSALDALQLADPVVANYLIDNLGLEKILLVPTHEEAIKLADTVENVPEHCSRLVTPDCSEYYPAPNYRYYGGLNDSPAPRFLQCSTEDRKRQLQAELQELECELRAADARAQQADEEAKQAKTAEAQVARNLQALMAEAHKKAAAAKMAESALQQHHAPQHDLLLGELNKYKEKVSTLTEKLQTVTSEKQTHQKKVDDLKYQINEVMQRIQKLDQQRRTIAEELQQEQWNRERGALNFTAHKQRVAADTKKLSQVQDILTRRIHELQAKVDAAETHGPRIQTPREKSLVGDELKKIKLKLTTYRNDGLTRDDVTNNLALAQKKYEENTNLLNILGKLIEKGDMIIDHERETLKITCTGRDSSEKRHASTTSSLSGGERSYSTVAFIMALWECSELPFYFMDEFDVFMDIKHRKIVMDLLIDYAMKNSNKQFVFLTPQDSSALDSGPQLSIHMMPDPIRT